MFPRPLDHNEGVGRKIVRRVLALGILTALAAVVLAADSGDTIPADGGAIQVTPVMRSSVQIEYGGKVIQVDPVSTTTSKFLLWGSLTNLLRP
jgi:uncharacterized protein YabE (DUF348 family)